MPTKTEESQKEDARNLIDIDYSKSDNDLVTDAEAEKLFRVRIFQSRYFGWNIYDIFSDRRGLEFLVSLLFRFNLEEDVKYVIKRFLSYSVRDSKELYKYIRVNNSKVKFNLQSNSGARSVISFFENRFKEKVYK